MDTREVLKAAKKEHLCKEWQNDFEQDHSVKNLCEKYFEGSDWAMEKDFPNINLLRKFKEETEEFGLYTDYEGTFHFGTENEPSKAAFFGNSVADIEAGEFAVCELYIRHKSKVKISATDRAYIQVNVLDSAEVEIEAEEQARVSVYNYSNHSKIRNNGNVKVIPSSFEE